MKDIIKKAKSKHFIFELDMQISRVNNIESKIKLQMQKSEPKANAKLAASQAASVEEKPVNNSNRRAFIKTILADFFQHFIAIRGNGLSYIIRFTVMKSGSSRSQLQQISRELRKKIFLRKIVGI